jgi:type I restriction enzyme S subunit
MKRRAPIAELAEINPGMPAALRIGDGERLVPFLPMAAVSEAGCASYDQRRPVGELLKGYTYFERGDVLVAKITPCLENGKAALLTDLPADLGFGSTEFHVLRPGPDVDPRYLFHAVWHNAFRRAGADAFTGTAGQKRLPASFFERYKIPLPAVAEQRRIAAMLGKADAVRRKRRESSRLLDEFVRSAFLEMFGDPVRNKRGWEVVRLASCLAEKPSIGTITPASDAGRFRLVRVGQLGQDGVALAQCGRVTVPLGHLERFVAREGDLLLARAIGSAEHLGKASVMQAVSEPIVFDSHVMRVRVDGRQLHARFLWHWLQTSGGRRLFLQRAGRTAVQFNINTAQVNDVRIPVPPIDQQEQFLELATRAGSIAATQQKALLNNNALFDSLASGAFEGRP